MQRKAAGDCASGPRFIIEGQTVETITGELIQHRIVGDDFWSIATVRASDGTVPVVGKLLGVQVGDTIEIEGQWNEHPRFGHQFKVSVCRVAIPQTDNGAIAWLAMRLPGIGGGRARVLLDHFGSAAGLWEAIEQTPERLAEVKGITSKRAHEIAAAYEHFREERDRMIRFRAWGMTENQVARMLAVWKDSQGDPWGALAERNLRANPYALADLVDGFGFLRADAIAQRMGVPLDSVGRIECGLKHTMKQATGSGHCYVPTGKLVNIAADKVLRLAPSIVAKHLAIMKERGAFVQHGGRVFTARLNAHERTCADRIRALLGW